MARRRGDLDRYHQEVLAALRKIGDPRYGAAVARDRGSSLDHLGISFPALRARVKQGFSFYDLDELETLERHAATLRPVALSRAIERLDPGAKAELRRAPRGAR